MSNLVPAEDIERIVGVPRHRVEHYGRAVSSERTVYILHSHECKDSGVDLRECMFSLVLDRGINLARWRGLEDRPVRLRIQAGELIPLAFTARGCPTCSGPIRETVEMVCQTCGTDYAREVTQ